MPIGLWKTATQFTHRANRLYCYKNYDLNNLYFKPEWYTFTPPRWYTFIPPLTVGGDFPALAKDKVKNTPADRMIFISAGKFKSGSDPDLAYSECLENNDGCRKSWFADESPVHSVDLDSFSIDQYEVTQGEYAKIMGNNPSKFNGENRPVENITWYEAKEYCEKVGKQLPTEAQWEKSAKGGIDTVYTWGNTVQSGRANFCDVRCDEKWGEDKFDDGHKNTSPVGSFPPNEYGLYDMAGNVYEWVSDWYDEDYYEVAQNKNPKGPSKGKKKGLRGGSWVNYSVGVRPTDRTGLKPNAHKGFVGFRCVSKK